MAFHVQYFSQHKGDWLDYAAPTFNSRAIVHPFPTDAEARMAQLQRDHPRDKFRVIELRAA